MNNVELSNPGGDSGADSSTQSPPLTLQYQITDFWPVTFVRQLIIMCTTYLSPAFHDLTLADTFRGVWVEQSVSPPWPSQ